VNDLPPVRRRRLNRLHNPLLTIFVVAGWCAFLLILPHPLLLLTITGVVIIWFFPAPQDLKALLPQKPTPAPVPVKAKRPLPPGAIEPNFLSEKHYRP
jgi:hypothetical protein